MNTIYENIANEISKNRCGAGRCPLWDECDVYSDEECILKLVCWLKEVATKDDWK